MSADHQTANKFHYSHQQLIDNGKFSKTDILKIQTYRGQHNRLGFAYQLIYVRILNYFPKQNPFEVKDEILSFVSLQLEMSSQNIKKYSKHQQHIARHQQHIREYASIKNI